LYMTQAALIYQIILQDTFTSCLITSN